MKKRTPYFADQSSDLSTNDHNLKGQSNEIFLTPVFFTKRLILVSIDMPQSNFEIFRILTELFVLKLL
jgi:hypothetical protein